jgi:polyhydroxybutyrate depolymerase
LPVVFNFHGLGSGAIEQEAYSGLLPLSESAGFLLVTPDGTGAPRAWNVTRFGGVDDVAFVNHLLDTLVAAMCVDEDRVYSTGMSNGALLSSLLGCALGGRVAAIAPVAGIRKPSAGCAPGMPVLAFHGTGDAVVPFEPGRVLGVLGYDGARSETAAWAALNGCQAEPVARPLSSRVMVESFIGCRGGDVALVIVDGGGHTWPGAEDVPRLGPTNHEISAAEMIWRFFATHQRR